MKEFSIKRLSTAVFSIAMLLFLLTACDKDEPTTAKIYGTITIENHAIWADWVDSGEVQLTIFPAFSLDPLAGWGEIPDGFYGPGVPGGTFPLGAPFNSQNPIVVDYVQGHNLIEYEIELDPGTYSALAIGFRKDDVTDANKRTAPLGVHWNNPTETSHGVIVKVDVGGGTIVKVFDENPPVALDLKAGDNQEINFKADFSIVNTWY